MKKLTVSDEAYWKLLEIKVRLRCQTWEEFADKVHKMVFRDEKGEQVQAETD